MSRGHWKVIKKLKMTCLCLSLYSLICHSLHICIKYVTFFNCVLWFASDSGVIYLKDIWLPYCNIKSHIITLRSFTKSGRATSSQELKNCSQALMRTWERETVWKKVRERLREIGTICGYVSNLWNSHTPKVSSTQLSCQLAWGSAKGIKKKYDTLWTIGVQLVNKTQSTGYCGDFCTCLRP